MTIVYRANEIQGLSTDTKPTLVPTNTAFFETDTLRTYNYDGTNWVLSGVGGSVSNAELDGNIAFTKIANGTAGKVIGFNASTGAVEEQTPSVGITSFTNSAVVSQSTTIGDYTTPTAAVVSSSGSPTTGIIDYLVIGGGAQGNESGGGGGNSGAINQASGYSIATGSFAITIGSGGAGLYQVQNGSSSTFGAITAAGGIGRGGTNGGGGNGVGGVGAAQTSLVGGVGGIGLASSITGSSLFYGGGGGGGGSFCDTSRSGSLGGSGVGGSGNSQSSGGAAVANRGSGGGGGGRSAGCENFMGGYGSAGIVIIKYITGQVTATGGTITTSGGNTIHSFTSNGTFTISAFASSSALAIDDNTATKWISTSSSNPNIYVDMGSALNLCAAAFYFDSTNTTNTEILIQSSADASTWTTKRTITKSNLTNGAYNFYRFNIAGGARYIRFYGNSAGSTVLSIWEIKILKKTDAEIFNDLGMLTITPNDTTLAADGT